ncbi:hypothetical protein AB0P21_18305 [Kribbella sp. NPDC056861]|uniref:hypothetical protein n=1 Tax=Kribbella sp. NPDC056861 TaxID=3154857 RepID=UPI003413C484
MATKRSLVTLTIATALALVATSCGDSGKDKAGTTPSSSASSSSTPAPPSATPTPSAPTPSAVPSAPVPPAAKARTAAELTKALLELTDLPAGLSIDKNAEEDDTKLSSADVRCKDLVLLFNSKTSPGAKVTVDRGFTGGQNGPFFDETLEAMGTPAAATALLTRTRTAIKSCKLAKLTIPGVGSSSMAVSEISAPKVGTNPVAGRFTAEGGALEGLEVNFVFTGVGDVVLTMTFDEAGDLEGAMTAATGKATKVLGAAKSGT